MRKKTIQVGIGAILIATATGMGFLIFHRDKSTLLSFPDDPAAIRPEIISIMNPFRNRGPERVAEYYLNELKNGNLAAVINHISSNRENSITEEPLHPIKSWKLGYRSDLGDKCILRYWVKRGNGYPGTEEVTFEIVWQNKWILQDYNAVY